MKKQFDFIKLQKIFIGISLFLIICSLWSIFGPTLPLGVATPKHFNLAIDFQGGLSQRVTVYSGISIEKMRELSEKAGLGNNVQEVIINQKEKLGSAKSFLIKTMITKEEQQFIADKKKNDVDFTPAKFLQDKTDALFKLITDQYGTEYTLTGDALTKAKELKTSGYEINGEVVTDASSDSVVVKNVIRESANTISPAQSNELKGKAIALVLFVLLIMLVYITLRFKIEYAIGAVLALFHDTIIMLGIVSFTGIELDMTVVAAVLTLIGYSINDTIVVFDRVRENFHLLKDTHHPDDIFNISINQTLNRTIVTSLTTFLAVFALYVWGGEIIRGFSFTFMVGIIIGTYSSIFIASPVVLIWSKILSKDKVKYKKMEEKSAKEEMAAVEGDADAKNDDNAISKKTLLKLQSKKKK